MGEFKEPPSINKSEEIEFAPRLIRNTEELISAYIHNSNEYLELRKKIFIGESSFSEINQLIKNFNESEMIKKAGLKFKGTVGEDGSSGYVSPVFIEIAGGDKIFKFDIKVDYNNGVICIENKTTEDGKIIPEGVGSFIDNQ